MAPRAAAQLPGREGRWPPAPQSHHRHYDAIRRFPGVQPHPRTTDTPERCHLGIDLFIFLHLNKKPDLLPFFFFFSVLVSKGTRRGTEHTLTDNR